MRIFLSCQQALKRHPVPAYDYWEYYFRNGLREAGHEIAEAPAVDWAEGLTPLSKTERAAWLGRTWTRTVDYVKAEHPRRRIDLFLSYLFPYQVDPSAVTAIRALGIPCVNFFCDNMREFSRIPQAFGCFNLHWVPEADARVLYARSRMPFIYAPMPMWVRPEFRDGPDAEPNGVVFVGSHDALREDLLGEAVGLGLQLGVYGSGWLGGGEGDKARIHPIHVTLANQVEFLRREGMLGWVMRATYQFRRRRPDEWIGRHAHPALDGDAYFRAMREFQVVIGINRCPSFRRPFSNPFRYSRLRDIEAPMLGACYLTEMAPGLGDLYEIGAEIETYRDAAELAEQSARLQADAPKRRRLRQLGQRRALADHTIGRSLARIIKELGISA